MWPFRRKKTKREAQSPCPPCSHCQSTQTELIAYHGTDQPDYVRTWRGQRYVTFRCRDCGQDFYAEEPRDGFTDEIIEGDRIIDNEEELRAAEEDLRKQIEKDGDRRFG